MTATRVGIGIATLLAWLAGAALLWRTAVPGDLVRPSLSASALFPAPLLERTADYARGARVLWLAGALVQLLTLVALVPLGPRLVPRLRGPAVARGVQLLLVVLAATWLARLPVAVAAQWWRRRYGLSDAGYVRSLVLGPWLELVGSALVACAALAVGMLLARRLGRRWWLAGAPALVAVGAGVVVLQPLLLAPKLEPLRDGRLAAEIRALGDELGVAVDRVEVRRASERTTRANAEVYGLGATRTVVLWDTLLDGRYPFAEIRFLAAHELAHVEARHVWKGLGWLVLLAVPCVWLLSRVVRLEDPAEVPRAVLAVVLIQLAIVPLTNAVSRRYEAEADWIALRATHDPGAAEATFRRFVRTNLTQPDPPAWARVVLGTHPTTLERIETARSPALRAGS
ncbi:MAG TPA: M48 family metalloprotease [Gaiellaceae bacterium]|nr:M48 family metalloprotease [Gaiellaceae bacterium]